MHIFVPAADMYEVGPQKTKYFKIMIGNVEHRDIHVELCKNPRIVLIALLELVSEIGFSSWRKPELVNLLERNIVFEE